MAVAKQGRIAPTQASTCRCLKYVIGEEGASTRNMMMMIASNERMNECSKLSKTINLQRGRSGEKKGGSDEAMLARGFMACWVATNDAITEKIPGTGGGTRTV